jgi:hypothetical protein
VFVALSKDAKLVYYYLYETADIAGFNDLSSSKVTQCTGLAYNEAKIALDELEKKKYLILSEERTAIWYTNYLKEQGNFPLNYKNSSHKGIIKAFKRRLFEFRKSIVNFADIPILKDKELITLKDILADDFAPYPI